MRWSHIGFIGRRVRNNLWELLWTHVLTASTMAMTLFLFGVFLLLQKNLQNLLQGWGDEIQIHAYLDAGLEPSELGNLTDRVHSFPEVERIRYISQDQAWKDFQSALGPQSGLLDGLPRDVLPASLEIMIKAPYRDARVVGELAERIGKEKGVASVQYPQEWVDRLSLLVLAVGWAKWTVGTILFVATFFIAGSTARLAVLARREEIEIMQLVGASEELIQAPFFFEGVLQGLVGAGVSIGLLWCLYWFLREQATSLAALFGPLNQFQFLDLPQLGLLVMLGCFLGAGGSLFSLRRFVTPWKE